MTEDEWIETYKPKQNHLDPNQSYLFETYGDELEYVSALPENNVWTLVDGDNGETLILSGYYFVNRIGYYVCEVPWGDEEFYEILINDGEEENEYADV